jgi:flagellar assembly factor FliW
MLINTRDFGEIDVTGEEILTFPTGLFAFEESRQFVLISPHGEDVYPKWLQSVQDVAPCFIVFDPTVVDENYTAKLESYDAKTLKISPQAADNNNIRLLVIATVYDDFKKTTVNMKAPIVINDENKLAAQVILSQDYDFRFPLYTQASSTSSNELEGEEC